MYNFYINLNTHIKRDHKKVKSLQCSLCSDIFVESHELELHHINVHKEVVEYSCEICNKTFMKKWRLEKHASLHKDEINHRKCHFFNNSKTCPYEIIGCKFLHSESAVCKFGNKCKKVMCQFRHL